MQAAQMLWLSLGPYDVLKPRFSPTGTGLCTLRIWTSEDSSSTHSGE